MAIRSPVLNAVADLALAADSKETVVRDLLLHGEDAPDHWQV